MLLDLRGRLPAPHLEQCVLQLDVSVADVSLVEVLHCQHQLLEEPPDMRR